MKEFLKGIAVKIGIGLPYFLLLYNSCDGKINTVETIIYGILFGFCIDLALWGLKKD